VGSVIGKYDANIVISGAKVAISFQIIE